MGYRSLTEWQALVGQEQDGPLRMEYERESGQDVSAPKHGKVSSVSFMSLQAYSAYNYIHGLVVCLHMRICNKSQM